VPDLADAPIAPPRHRRTIGRLLIMIGAVTAAFILLLSLVLANRLSSEKAILEDMAQVMRSVSNETVENTASFLAPAERNAAELANFAAVGQLDAGAEFPPEQFLFEVLRVHESFDGIFVGQADGSFLYVSRAIDGDGYATKSISIDAAGVRSVRNQERDRDFVVQDEWLDDTDEYDPRERPWYSLASQADDAQGVWTDPYLFFSSGLPGVTRAHATTLPSGNAAVVGIDIRIDELSTFIAERRASENGQSFIVDRALTVVAHPDKTVLANETGLATTADVDDPLLSFVADRLQSVEGATLKELTTGSVDNIDHHFALTSLSANDDWVIAVTAPDEDFLGRIRDAQRATRRLSTVGGLASVAVLLAGGVVVNNRYRSERTLAESALVAAEARAEERDVAQQALAQSVDDLARSNADLEQYVYAAAHDLRTPLRAMGGYADLLLREADDQQVEPELLGYANRIVESYERMSLTMDNLLEHARSAAIEPASTAVPLAPIVQDAFSDFEGEIDNLGVVVAIGHLPEAAVDPIAMRRVFQNLISNSMKYRNPDRICRIEVSGERVGDESTVRFVDNGIGIAPADQDRVFRLFSRLSSGESGTGVGLALVKKLVEEHHGDIVLTSTAGDGAAFTITLPASPVGDIDVPTGASP